jgi:hypothetical protein
MIGGTEEKYEVLKLIQAVSGPKFVTRPAHIHRAAGGDGQQDCGSDVTRYSFRRSQLIAIGFNRHLPQDVEFLND